MVILGFCQVPLTSVPLEAEEKSNNNLSRKLLCREIQFMAPVDLHGFDSDGLKDVS